MKLAPIPMLDLSRQYTIVGEEIQAALAEIGRAGRFVLGKEVQAFETAAAAMLGTTHAIGCSSGTEALWLALDAAGVRPGDKVITSPFSFFATASAILRCGAQPVMADIDPVTFNLSPLTVTAILERNSDIKAVLPVHLYGQCADFDALNRLKIKHNLLLVEDAAQAFGAKWNGIPAGALGDSAAFSFYPTKNLSAWGDAGLVTTSDDTIADRANLLHVHGMRERYFHEIVGWNARMDTMQAAVLLIKLRHIEQWNLDRARIAARYHWLFADSGLTLGTSADAADLVLPQTDPRATHVWHQYVIRSSRRNDLRAHLTASGIGTEIYYPLSLHQQQALASLDYVPGDFPHSECAAREVLAIPIFPELREDEQDRVVEAIVAFHA
ncbi:DegT/DnrJ/EryC1/StrS family aminotransferase [Terriglobus saanensis]|uniref:DegT/DnrJ/EryC1/StrS aminotransferase n=1 Tax=Terriglobus saanensis (strain ATCC BAA-1853 / DSM 23119 / SP1PR4) TaxID=401053 RepID=E8V844_TERSS|nr:DegT/DnrJ/EryC1/StrS aminotransferase [Terriglobus saanensis SP1PR4]